MNDINSISHIGRKCKCNMALEIRSRNGIHMRYGGRGDGSKTSFVHHLVRLLTAGHYDSASRLSSGSSAMMLKEKDNLSNPNSEIKLSINRMHDHAERLASK